MMPCSIVQFLDVAEEPATSTFRVKKLKLYIFSAGKYTSVLQLVAAGSSYMLVI
jgi:hypothetical protein